MLSSLTITPPALASRDPPPSQPSRRSWEYPAPRSSSFGRLNPFGSRERVFGGHFRRTNDSTVKMKSEVDDDEEGVMVDYPDSHPLCSNHTPPRVIDLSRSPHVKKIRPTSLNLPLSTGQAEYTAGQCDSPYHSPELSRLIQNARLSHALNHDHSERTRLSRSQIANFRKGSAKRAVENVPHISTTVNIMVNSAPTAVEPNQALHVQARADEGPGYRREHATLVDSMLGHTPGDQAPVVSPTTSCFPHLPRIRLKNDNHDSPSSSSRQARPQEPGKKAGVAIPSRPNIHQPRFLEPTVDLDRPLPPLPIEPSLPIRQLRRKAVPPPLAIPIDVGRLDASQLHKLPVLDPPTALKPGASLRVFESFFRASEVARKTLEQSVANGLQLTLRDELEMAVREHGKQPPRLESSFDENLSSSVVSRSTINTEQVATPPDTLVTSDCAEDLETFRHFQSVIDHLEAQNLTEEKGVTLKSNPDYRHTPQHAYTDGTDRQDGLRHVQSIRAEIEGVSPLKSSETGLLTNTPFKRPQHQRNKSEQHGSRDVGALASGTPEVQTFIPSGRSFEPLRINRHPRPSGFRPVKIMSPNGDQPDIRNLRRALKPTTTGNKVKKVVEKWEHQMASHETSVDSRG